MSNRKYSLAEMNEKIVNASTSMRTFYQQKFINYKGRICDADKNYCTEVVAKWCNENIALLKGIGKSSRKDYSYKTASHDNVSWNPNSPREEEVLAKKMYRQKDFDIIGEIIDYQTPLKNSMHDEYIGKIDLVAYNKETKILRLMELKRPKNEESMLRCVLEGYTYLKLVDHLKLLRDFKIIDKDVTETDIVVKACPLVHKKSLQAKQMQEALEGGRPELKKLRGKDYLDSEPLYYEEIDGEFYISQ
ncbi:TPA: hypothetical protein IAC10_13505 [Candidatus Scatousia excrementigallinarum]|uniref:Uncharacterized protein n=1 Tax=Candidatus Scatousia excrementigallinarum TaxID=2840935 RepID=A0A9D1F173_9BACT|nr:hypothetical protein [Candidatus Scatousia excrementigallinarum]